MSAQLAADVLALVACILAVIADERTRRIPNWLTGGTAVLALALHGALALQRAHPAAYLGATLAGGVAALLLFVGLSFVGLVGFGDSKLMGALGLCVGWPLVLSVIVCTFVMGGLLALVTARRQRTLGRVLENLAHPGALPDERVDEAPRRLHLMPYALAIALGTAWAILGRHIPAVAPF